MGCQSLTALARHSPRGIKSVLAISYNTYSTQARKTARILGPHGGRLSPFFLPTPPVSIASRGVRANRRATVTKRAHPHRSRQYSWLWCGVSTWFSRDMVGQKKTRSQRANQRFGTRASAAKTARRPHTYILTLHRYRIGVYLFMQGPYINLSDPCSSSVLCLCPLEQGYFPYPIYLSLHPYNHDHTSPRAPILLPFPFPPTRGPPLNARP